MIADQDQKIEKVPEGSDINKTEKESNFGLEESEKGLAKESNLENISSPDSDQEKKNEVMEAIQQKGNSGSDDDDDEDDDEEGHAIIHSHAKDIYEIKDVEQQIDKLVQLAIQKDPFIAIKVARHLDENYVLDQVHDKLVEDKTRNILIEKGLLESI